MTLFTAYLDPGSGSAIIQGIIAALAAGLVALKLYWHKVLQVLGLRKKSSADESSQENQKSESK